MLREIVEVDEALCDGCGDCVPSCAEGALQVVDGKVRLVGDVLCDGLGACLGECPKGALKVARRDVAPFDERAVEAHLRAVRSGRAPPPGEPWPPDAKRIDELLVGAFGGRPRDQRVLVRVIENPDIIRDYLRETAAGRGSQPVAVTVCSHRPKR